MKRYIIELEAGKIFSYEVASDGRQIHCRLLKPHGDKFYSPRNYSDYWNWFEAETFVDEPDICFIYQSDGQRELERLKNAAPKFNRTKNSTWLMSELKKFFADYRDAPLKENFQYNETLRQITFDGVKTFRLDGSREFTLSDDTPPARAEEVAPKSKFKIRVYSPAESQKVFAAPPVEIKERNTAPEKNIPEVPKSPAELKEKISAEDLLNYIEEQIGGQCDRVSFKK